MSNPIRLSLWFCCIWLLASGLAVQAQVSTTFDTSLEGWMVTGDNEAAWEGLTGNPGGCLSVNDLATGAYNRLVAPRDYHGDWSGFAVTDTLSYDVYLDNISSGTPSSHQFMMEIAGPGGRASAIETMSHYPVEGIWNTYLVALDESEWIIDSGTWANILANVTSVLFNGEFVIGDEIVRIDNVNLPNTPIPVVVPCEFDDFSEAGTGDWSFQGTGGVANPGSGGNGGGYIEIGDQSSTNSYAMAPSRYLGDWSSLDGTGMVTIDLRILDPGITNVGAPEFIRLSGPGGSAYFGLTPAQLPASDRVWKTYELPIDTSTFSVDSGSWTALLADVTEILIDLEFYDGLETVGFDNFGRLAAGCPAIDYPVLEADPTVTNCGWHNLVGVSGVGLNPLDGELYGVIHVSTAAGGGLYPVTGPGAGVRLEAYDRPAHLIFDTDGDAFISENYSGEINRLAWGGASSIWVTGFHSGDDDPWGMTFAPSGFNGPNVAEGDILVADYGNSGPDEIWAFSPDTAEGELQVMPDPGSPDHADLASSQAGTVYICDALDPSNLYTLAPDGTLLPFALVAPMSGMVSLVYDDTDAVLYVAENLTDSVFRVDPGTGGVTLVANGFDDLGWGCLEIDNGNRELWVADTGYGRVYRFCLPGWTQPTVDVQYTCLPSSGTVPFVTQMTVTMTNLYTGQIRRIAGHIDVRLANSTFFPNWRAGFTNVSPGSNYISSWNQSIPALGSVIGDNIFTMVAEDVTPAPYNQPPYPQSGDTDIDSCSVTGIAP